MALKSCGGTKGKTYKTIIDTKVDLIFIVSTDFSMYLIPKEKIRNRSTLNLCKEYEKYKVMLNKKNSKNSINIKNNINNYKKKYYKNIKFY